MRSYIPLLHEDTVAGDKKIRKRKPAVSSLMFIRQSEHYLLEIAGPDLKASCPFMAFTSTGKRKTGSHSDREMELFMQITSADTSDLEYFSDEAIDYRSGDKVRVTGGPFKGAGCHQADPGQPPPGRRSGRHHRRSDDLHPGTFPEKNA